MKKFKFLSICCLLFMCFLIPAHAENMDGGDYIPPGTPEPKYDSVYKDCLIDDYECIASHIEGIGAGTPEDYKQAIRSFDEEIAAKEVDKDYLNNFMNSTMTAMTENVSLLKPHTIVMQIANFLVTLFETIGGTFSLLCLIAYNLMSGSFIDTTVMGSLEKVTSFIFDWKNTSSWIYNILFLIAMIALVRKILVSMGKRGGVTSSKNICFIIFETICSIAMIVFIGLYGRTTIHYIENMAESSIVQTFTFGESNTDPLEIRTKDKIFQIMQMKPFMMRHFGTSDIARLPINDKAEYSDLNTFNKGRVKALLSEPSTERALEEKEIGNNVIPQGIGTSAASIGISFLGLIHKAIAGCIILPLTIALGAIRLIKEILLFFSIFGLIFMMLNPKCSKAYNWFFNRLMWMLVSVLAEVTFSIILFAWASIMDSITGYGFVLAIVFDIILLVLIILAWKFRDVIITKFKEITANHDMDGVFNGILTGNLSPTAALSMLQSEQPDNKTLPSNHKNQTQSQGKDDSSFTSQDYNDDLADKPEGCINNDNLESEVQDNEYDKNIDNTNQPMVIKDDPSLQEKTKDDADNITESASNKSATPEEQSDAFIEAKDEFDNDEHIAETIDKDDPTTEDTEDDIIDYDDSLSDEMQNQLEGNYPMNSHDDDLTDDSVDDPVDASVDAPVDAPVDASVDASDITNLQQEDDVNLVNEQNDTSLEEIPSTSSSDASPKKEIICDDSNDALNNPKELNTPKPSDEPAINTLTQHIPSSESNSEEMVQLEANTNYEEADESTRENDTTIQEDEVSLLSEDA